MIGLKSEVEARKTEAKSLIEDNTRWKGRAQQILEKYERIDPVEHEGLKNSVQTLTTAKEEMEKQIGEIRGELQGVIAKKEEEVKKILSKIAALQVELAQVKEAHETALKQKETDLAAGSNEQIVRWI